MINKELQDIIEKKLKDESWLLFKATGHPIGYVGYIFTLYDKDGSELVELKAKTPAALAKKIIRTFRII